MLGRARATLTPLLAVTLVGLSALGSGVASAAPRECGVEALNPKFPQYARAGGMIDIPTSDYSSGRKEFSGAVEVVPSNGEPSSHPLELTDTREASWGGLEGHIVVPAPARRDQATRIVITWIERETYGSSTFECSARAVGTIPIVPLGGKVGDPSVPRLEGRFRISYRVTASGIRGVDRTDRGIWRLRPRCRYLGCPTRVRSTLGLRGTFATSFPSDRHHYFMSRDYGRRAVCFGTTRNRFTGELIRRWKIRRAYKLSREIRLGVTEETSAGLVTAFYGKSVVHFEPIRSAKGRGCPDKYVVERIRGRLIRS